LEHVKYDLRQLKKGSTVVVTLGSQTNVMLLDASNYRAYASGRRFEYFGGKMTRSPARLTVPRDGHWYVAIDLGGYGGRIRSGVAVEPPPRGFLPPMREQSSLEQIRRNLDATPPPAGVMDGRIHDVFISYASEDGPAVAHPLAAALTELDVDVWLDELKLTIGDSLRRSIDRGIASSRFAVVVFSKPYFTKGWTQYELDGIVTRNTAGEQNLLPLWHNVTKDEVVAYSPSLADKLARSTATHAIDEIAREIAGVVNPATDAAT
jgi:hypothetical protein